MIIIKILFFRIKMGWDYNYEIAYGIILKTRGNQELKEFIEFNSDVFGYSGDLSIDESGTSFIYLCSTYEEICIDSSSYLSRSPDITEDEFREPKHKLSHEIVECDTPILNEGEKQLAKELNQRFASGKGEFIWISRYYISY